MKKDIILNIEIENQEAQKRAEKLSNTLFKQKQTLSDLRKEINQTLTQRKAARAQIDKLKKANQELNNQLKAGTISQEDYNKSLNKNNASIKQAEANYSELEIQLKDLSGAFNVVNQSVKETSSELRKTNKDANVISGSLNAQRRELSRLLEAYDDLDVSTKAGRKEAKALKKEINDLTETISDAEQGTGRFQRAVGNYKNSVIAAFQSSEIYNGVLGDILNTLQAGGSTFSASIGLIGSLGDGFQFSARKNKILNAGIKATNILFKLLKIAIASTGIGLLIVALGSLAAFFIRTEKGARILETGLTIVSVVFGKLADAAAVLGEKIFDFFGDLPQLFSNIGTSISSSFTSAFEAVSNAFQNPIKTIKSLGQTLKEAIFDKFPALKTFSEAAGSLFSGDFEKAGDLAKKGFEQIGDQVDQTKKDIQTGFQEGADSLNNFANSAIEGGKSIANDFTNELSKAIEEGKALAASNIALRNSIRQNRIEAQKFQAESEKFRKIRDDERLSIDDRIKANKEALKFEDLRFEATKKRLNDEKQLILNQAKTRGKLSEDQKDELADLNAELFDLDDDYYTRTTELQTEANNLRKDKTIQAFEGEKAAIDAQLLLVTEGSEKEIELKRNQAAAERNLALAKLEAESTNEKDKANQKLLIEAEYQRKLKDLKNEASAAELERIKTQAEAESLALTEEQKKTNEAVKNLLKERNQFVTEENENKRAAQITAAQAERDQLLLDESITQAERLKIIAEYKQKEAEINQEFLDNYKTQKEAEQSIDLSTAEAKTQFASEIGASLGAIRGQLEENTIASKILGLAEVGIQTGVAIAKANALGFPANIPLIGQAIATGLKALNTIKAVKFAEGGFIESVLARFLPAQSYQKPTQSIQKYASGGLLSGPSHAAGGIKAFAAGVPIELEGREYVTNKKATLNNLPALNLINKYGAFQEFSVVPKFEMGGFLGNIQAGQSIDQAETAQSFSQKLPPIVTDIQEFSTVQNRVLNRVKESTFN